MLGGWGSEGLDVVLAWSWRSIQRKRVECWELTTIRAGQREAVILPDLHAAGEWIRQQAGRVVPDRGAALVVEGLFGRGPTLERLSWYAGLVSGPLLGLAAGPVARPLASQWRREVLGIKGGTTAEVCEARAVAWAAEHVRGLGELGDVGHACEAACMAAWRACSI